MKSQQQHRTRCVLLCAHYYRRSETLLHVSDERNTKTFNYFLLFHSCLQQLSTTWDRRHIHSVQGPWPSATVQTIPVPRIQLRSGNLLFFLQKHHILHWDFALAVNLSAQVIKLTANRCKRGINLSAASFCRMSPAVLCASSWKKSRNVPFHQVDLSSNLLAVYLTITSTQSGSPWWRQTCLSRDLWNNCRAENQQNATAAAQLSGFSQQQQQRCRSSGLSFCLISAVHSHQQP